ncbi:MAG: efflux RND transporter periplasmic adaptor subunit [Lentisphaeria bacterium]|nr:efflux RND transporter periplasmic adaptor subunit [Lentisphaeria bacterium]
MKKFNKFFILIIVIIAVILAIYKFFFNSAQATKNIVFTTEVLQKGDVIRSISATGTVEPEELINVGAQVNGRIMSFGIDADGKTVDYGSRVKKGAVLALIDDVTYKSDLKTAQAAKAQATASILSAEASIKECAANEILAKNNWARAEKLSKQKIMSESEADSAKAAYESAIAQSAKARASLEQAKASLLSAEAALVKAERNLEYCSIVSPVDGIIIDRRVSIGQTVVSNQTASSIFLVAKDFKKMQVWVSVNEADIGDIKPGMEVQFTCDAFPNEFFKGVVHRIRMNATLSSNVVTYIVEVNADNDNLRLIPYLTANVKFIRDARRNVLNVSNSILRFRPDANLIEGEIPPHKLPREAILYVEKNQGKLTPVKVKVGLNNGSIAEIISDEIKAGDKIVVGISEELKNTAAPNSESTKNPFLPTPPKRSNSKKTPAK